MNRHADDTYFDDDDADALDREGPDARDLPADEDGSDDSDDTLDCPHCGRAVYATAERCPACGQYIADAAVERQSRPLWVVLTVILCLIMLLLGTIVL